MRTVLIPSILAALSMLSTAAPVRSQTRVRAVATAAKPQELRAVGVLEWTGEAGKPSASRLIPVAIFTGDEYQDAGVYMARPEPLALEGDTEYELQQAGVPKGLFDIFNAGNVEGFWYGYGVWKPTFEARPAKLSLSKVMPQVVKDSDPDRPHFNKKSDEKIPDSKPGPADKAPGSDTSSPGAGAKPQASGASDDPDRPKLRKRPKPDSPGDAPFEAVTGSTAIDPDRPILHRGKPETLQVADKLTGTPPNLQQMVAISTTTAEEPHPYLYHWANPEDATKMQSALEKLAREALVAKYAPPAKAAPRKAHMEKSVKAPAMSLAVDDFRTYELAYNGGATLVFSCRTLDEGDAMKFVTIIAQPDFYGSPRVLLMQVTDAGHLDRTPRMRLIDVADTNGDHRAELVFELRGKGERQFAIYRVSGGRAQQVFLSATLPR